MFILWPCFLETRYSNRWPMNCSPISLNANVGPWNNSNMWTLLWGVCCRSPPSFTNCTVSGQENSLKQLVRIWCRSERGIVCSSMNKEKSSSHNWGKDRLAQLCRVCKGTKGTSPWAGTIIPPSGAYPMRTASSNDSLKSPRVLVNFILLREREKISGLECSPSVRLRARTKPWQCLIACEWAKQRDRDECNVYN